MPVVDPAHLRALIVAYRPGDFSARALAIAADPVWGGPEFVEAGGVRARVVGCRSPLAVREALAGIRPATGELLVVLTPCTDGDLGPDVGARLLRHRVVPCDPFESLLGLFRAQVVDPQLVALRWLVEDLIALAPPGGWTGRRPLGAVLDVDLAWRVWHEARLGIDRQPETVADVLAVGGRPAVVRALGGLPEEARAGVAARWSGGSADSPVPVMVGLIAAGRGADLAALGLVAEALWTQTESAEGVAQQREVRARLEPFFGRDALGPEAVDAWARAASSLLDAEPALASAALDRAEAVLFGAGGSRLAALSANLPAGFGQRLAALGRSLSAGDVGGAEADLAQVREHRQAARLRHRVETAEAAVRLLRRRSARAAVAEPPTLAVAAAYYVDEGAWVDEACRLLHEGDQPVEVTAAYCELAAGVDGEQTVASHRFASLLAEWSAAEPLVDPRIVPVERILDDVVARVAEAAPVLLVVCDGMSLAVSHPLVRSLKAGGWARVVPGDRVRWPVGVAALPTVTEVSRTSLLAGRLVAGGQAEERAGFESHVALRARSSADRPPVLFHKARLMAPNGIALPDDVRQSVADPDQRVVGVVVNSVDDHLARGDQVRVGWDLTSLRPLPWLLDAAAEAGRIVILTADHGHVLHGPAAESRPEAGGGERWRAAGRAVGEGEVEVAGPRVLLGGERIVLPSDDRLRYGGFKHGYHGGATPEEVLVPVEVLARRLPAGWDYAPSPEPPWWPGETAATPTIRVSAPPAGTVPVTPSLFDLPTAPARPEATWVDALLATPAFAAQRARLPRPVPDERLRRYLGLIDGNGGSIPLAALAHRTGEPTDMLRLALALVQRLLNLDGAEVLTVRADGMVVLNRELADLQFEIGDR